MPGIYKKEDLRIIKTHRALMDAMDTLLCSQNFSQLTVNDLCDEARISRTAFYTHFSDKYDLLAHWLVNTKPDIDTTADLCVQVECTINYYLYDKRKIVRNLLENANNETLETLHDFVSLLIKMPDKKSDLEGDDASPDRHVLSIFTSGGLIHFISWQVRHDTVNACTMDSFYRIIKYLLEWDA